MIPDNKKTKYEAIVVGVSAGGYAVLNKILPDFASDFPVPVIIVRHMHHDSDDYSIRELDKKCALTVKIADEKELVEAGNIYFAPPNYHLLIERDHTFSLSVAEHVNYARPSVDVLFESASDVYRNKLIGVILTGANNDGSKGLNIIKNRGGIAIVQDPDSAEMAAMPKSAMQRTEIDYVLPPDKIALQLTKLVFSTKYEFALILADKE